ncbi:MAG TPA: enolase C-terminal domain-like protein, partial [Fimbriimonas sp.]|nr:enolase C-terminal domain-like protein [Fimbriimonas sp.]
MPLQFNSEIRTLNKLFPLTISRGTTAQSDNLYVFLSDGEHTGVGELSPATGKSWTAQRGQEQLTSFFTQSGLFKQVPAPHDVWQAMADANIDPPAMAALDIALWDLMAKRAKMPLHQYLGLPFRAVPTSVTIGLNPPEVTTERVPKILENSKAKCLKIKLGSPKGIEYDKSHFLAAKAASTPYGSILRVDANGGWSVADAIHMTQWLAQQGVDYVEQPLVEGGEGGLAEVSQHSPLPIYIDESIKFASDVPKWANSVT